MTFNGGDLTGSGTVAASVALTNASLTPGAPAGTLTFNGNLALGTAPSSTLSSGPLPTW